MPFELGSFSLGVLAGSAITILSEHLLARVRDVEGRSAENFNEKAIALAEILTRERIEPSPGSNIDFVPFSLVLGKRELSKFNKCVAEYESAKESAELKPYDNSGPFIVIGSGRYQDSAPIVAAIDKLLKFTKRR